MDEDEDLFSNSEGGGGSYRAHLNQLDHMSKMKNNIKQASEGTGMLSARSQRKPHSTTNAQTEKLTQNNELQGTQLYQAVVDENIGMFNQ